MFQKKEAAGLRLSNTILYVLMIAANAAFEILALNGVTTAEVSARNDTLLTPPGFTFSIWGVIYAWLFLWILYQHGWFHRKDEGDNPDLVYAVSMFFIISSVGNIGWLYAWHYEFLYLSLVFIVLLWASLFLANGRLNREVRTRKETFFVKMPFSIYFAWVTAALAVNFLVVFNSLTGMVSGLTQEGLAVGSIIIILLFAEYFVIRYRDFVIGLTAMWVFAGLIYRYYDLEIDAGAETRILLLASIGSGVLLLSLLVAGWMSRNKSQMT